MARDERPRARALAGSGLERSSEPGDHQLVLELLSDPDPAVELATLQGLAESPLPEAKDVLVQKSKQGPTVVRAAALRALAALRDPDVLGHLLEALADDDPAVQQAGTEALADLADPRSASFLAALLGRGPSSPLFLPARRGLKRLGPAGVDECLRLSRSTNPRTRREAALLLAEDLVPECAPLLLTLLSEDPTDERVAWELAVLSGVDLRSEQHPETAWWEWWDMVVHDDARAWLLAAGERYGVAPPAVREGADWTRFLLALLELDAQAPHVVERAARELERNASTEFARPSAETGREGRVAWRAEIREAVRARSGE